MFPIWAPAKTSDILEQLHQDIDTWYYHETLRNDRGDTKNDDFWFDTHVCLILLHTLNPQERWGTHKKRWPCQPRPLADVIGLVRCSYIFYIFITKIKPRQDKVYIQTFLCLSNFLFIACCNVLIQYIYIWFCYLYDIYMFVYLWLQPFCCSHLPTSGLYRSPLRPMEAIAAAGVVDNGACGGRGWLGCHCLEDHSRTCEWSILTYPKPPNFFWTFG